MESFAGFFFLLINDVSIDDQVLYQNNDFLWPIGHCFSQQLPLSALDPNHHKPVSEPPQPVQKVCPFEGGCWFSNRLYFRNKRYLLSFTFSSKSLQMLEKSVINTQIKSVLCNNYMKALYFLNFRILCMIWYYSLFPFWVELGVFCFNSTDPPPPTLFFLEQEYIWYYIKGYRAGLHSGLKKTSKISIFKDLSKFCLFRTALVEIQTKANQRVPLSVRKPT